MRNITPVLLICALAIGTISAAIAQTENRPEKRMGRIAQKLDLSEQQQQKFHEIMQSHREKRKALREEHIASVNAILTAEQQEKFEQMRAERKAKRRERMRERKHNFGQQ